MGLQHSPDGFHRSDGNCISSANIFQDTRAKGARFESSRTIMAQIFRGPDQRAKSTVPDAVIAS